MAGYNPAHAAPAEPSLPAPPGTSLSIRGEYESHGVEAYYRRFGHQYRNPHEPAVVRSLTEAVHRWRLDLAARARPGRRERRGHPCASRARRGAIDAADPFTHAAYAARTGARASGSGSRTSPPGAGRPVVRADRLQLRAAPVRAVAAAGRCRGAEPARAVAARPDAAQAAGAPGRVGLGPGRRVRPRGVRTRWYRSAHADATPASAP